MIDFSSTPLALAPLAGYTDLPFRKVCKKFGADITFSEMISSNALVFQSKKTYKMLEFFQNENPFFVQLVGNDEEVIKKAVLILNQIDGIAGIDLNCGCPVPKMISCNAGSALLKDLSKITKLLSIIKEHSNKRYTSVKVRLGFDTKIPQQIAIACEKGGVDFISVHGRTRADGYKKVIDYDGIKLAKEAVSVPIFANGDITSVKIASMVKKHTKCDGLMIGRGAIGNPWIFQQIKNNDENLSSKLRKEVILEHFDAMIDFHDKMGVKIFRKHAHTYSKGIDGASKFRDEINKLNDVDQTRQLIESFF